jgi:hypothetical protein
VIGDWGLGIGDWAQSSIHNPQSPIPIPVYYILLKISIIFRNNIIIYLSLINGGKAKINKKGKIR